MLLSSHMQCLSSLRESIIPNEMLYIGSSTHEDNTNSRTANHMTEIEKKQ